MTLRRLFLAACFFSFATLLTTRSAFAATYYVSPSGNDSNNGTSESTAWRTIQRSGTVARAGDTVLIAPGTYTGSGSPILQPANSGTASQPIVFRAQNSTRPVLDGTNTSPNIINLDNRDYITIEGLELRDPCNNWCNWMTLSNADHNTINDVRFIMTHNSTGVNWAGIDIQNSTYNRLTNCYVDGWGLFGDPYNNGGDAIQLNGASHHNLVEGCFIGAAGHAGLQLDGGDTYFNVIRNNTFQNRLEKAFETTQRRAGRFEYNLFEGNTCLDARYNSEFHGGMCLHINANHNIIRRNVLRGALGWAIDVQVWGSETLTNVGNHIFNNTIVNNGLQQEAYNAYTHDAIRTTGIQLTDFGYSGAPHRDHRIKNNILYDNKPQVGVSPQGKVQLQLAFDGHGGGWSGTQVAGNLMYSNAANEVNVIVNGFSDNTVAWFNQNQSANFWSNISAAPIFVAYNQGNQTDPLDGTYDLRLQANSPGVDQGVNLTQTTAAGSGTVITVQDAGYFHDGFDGIIAPDQIVVGSEQVTITDIDYAINRITVNRSISWNANAGVNLPFSGNAPDIGAYETGSAGPTPSSTPTPAPSTTPTPTPSAACRADVNGDTAVNAADRTIILSNMFSTQPTNARADINGSGQVDVIDYSLMAAVYGQRCQ